MNTNDIYLAIIIMSIVNLFTRAFPFIFFLKKEPPTAIKYIEKYFPPIIMTILILYTIKDINFTIAPYGYKEISAILSTVILHILFKNYLISIFAGTIIYMLLKQSIFFL